MGTDKSYKVLFTFPHDQKSNWNEKADKQAIWDNVR